MLHAVRTGGPNPPVVLLHGLMGSGACWGPIARMLDFAVVMPDLRGHGRSFAPERGYTYDDHAGDVIELIRELPSPVLVGHSMGGMVASVVATRHPLRGLVLVDPTFLEPERQREVYVSDVAEQHRRALALTKEDLIAQARARHPRRSLELIELQAEARLQTSLAALEVLAPPNPPYREVVAAITAPTLLVIGDTDPVVTPAMAAALGLRTVVIANAGHGLPFEQPERLAEVVAAFVRELP